VAQSAAHPDRLPLHRRALGGLAGGTPDRLEYPLRPGSRGGLVLDPTAGLPSGSSGTHPGVSFGDSGPSVGAGRLRHDLQLLVRAASPTAA
jgi:hypothetical protein